MDSTELIIVHCPQTMAHYKLLWTSWSSKSEERKYKRLEVYTENNSTLNIGALDNYVYLSNLDLW